MHPLIREMEARAARQARGPTRRTVLKAGAGSGLIVLCGACSTPPAVPRTGGLAADGTGTGPFAPNAFVRIGSDDIVTIVCKHHEMGQGNMTGLASIVADELDADWARVRAEQAPSNAKLYNNLAFGPMQGTGGSSAIANAYEQMREAGATARAMLVAAAAQAWGVDPAEIRTRASVLSHASGRRATYGEMAEAASRLPLPDKPALKSPAQFVYIGKERGAPRVDSPSKCDGTAVYTSDVKLPGLLTALIAWPPSFGARLVSFDASAARQVKGVVDVVQVPEGVAVVATGTWAALQGRRALVVQWDESAGRALDSDALLASYRAQAARPGLPFTKPAAPQSAAAGVKTVDAVYEFPFLAHATMEPMNCVAWLHDGQLDTWSGHQFPSLDHQFAAQAAGLPMERVHLHSVLSGGSFGRRANGAADFTVAAVHVAKAIGGRAPVRLQYMREDDMGAGYYRPLVLHAVRASVDGRGRIADWSHTIVGQSIMAGTPMASMIKEGIDETLVEGVHPSAYDLPMLRGQAHMPVLPVRPLWWRSVGNTHTAFVMETMVDELAEAAGRDPLEFRLDLLHRSPRAAGVLRLAAEKAGWGRAGAPGSALGLAVHESFKSFVAQVAEVSMRDGKLKVERVVCAVDCGLAVNPDVVRAQMEGGIGFALGALYYGEIELRGGRAVQRNFDGYRSLRLHEMPRVEVHIVPSPEAPTGVGEPGVPPLAPAVVNAMARLGVPRVRRLPLSRGHFVAT